MTSSRSASRSFTISGIIALAGVASSAVAGGPYNKGNLVPTRKAGVMYINMGTGERTLTRYDAELVPEIDVARSTASLFDYWMSIDENPCWDDPRETGFGFLADSTTDVSEGITTSAVSWDYGDMPFDSKITGIWVSTIVLHSETTDSNGDGVLDSGVDAMMVYYDALSEGNRTSIAPPTAVVRVESIPGSKPGYSSPGIPDASIFDDYDIIVDFGGSHFELGDSDLAGLGTMNLPGAASGFDFSTLITTTTTTITTTTTTTTGGKVNINVNFNQNFHPGQVNPTPDGLADFQYLQYYVKHGGDDKVTSNSTFVGLAVPTGGVTVIQTFGCTYVSTQCPTPSGGVSTCTFSGTLGTTILTPDPLPAGQSTFESYGFGILDVNGDVTSVSAFPGLPAGCCYWFGGLDCIGFLNNLVEDPPYNETWFDFSPFAQFSAGFFTDAPSNTACDAIDYNNDGFIDSGDISEFITLFLSGAPPADVNNDGFVDSGDIGTFVELFLSCVANGPATVESCQPVL